MFLRRNKLISDSNREAYQNFVKLAAQLFRIPKRNIQNLKKFEMDLQNTQPLVDEEWLMEKWKEKMGEMTVEI